MDKPTTIDSPVTRDKAALVELLQSRGWALVVEAFTARATAERVLDDLAAITDDGGSPGSLSVELRLRELVAARTALRAVLAFPRQRLAELLEARESAAEVPRGMPPPAPHDRAQPFSPMRRG